MPVASVNEISTATQRNNSPTMQKKKLYVTKRDGSQVPVSMDKITKRLEVLCSEKPELDQSLDPTRVSLATVRGLYQGIKTSEIDNLAAETAASMTSDHPDYAKLAARIAVSNLHRETSASFFETMRLEYESPKGRLLADDVWEIISDNAETLDECIMHERDYNYSYFGFKTLCKSYLVSINDKIIERPQYMLMRVAIGIHKRNIDAAIETYAWMSSGYFTHATPTLFNAGTPNPQMSSCFLLAMKEDSIDGIYETLKRCALLSKSAGGIGLSVSDIRATDSYIRGTNGKSNGLVPMLRVFNDTARYVDQGGGKRKGAFAIYLEPWHADIFEFLDLKKNEGKEEMRARDLFYGLWIPDLFMKRVDEDGDWSLFCPNEAKGLPDCWGHEFEALYCKYEATPGLARKKIKARDLWFYILDTQTETGTPYMLYKDACNRKSNQNHLGTIRSSNLCTEIVEYTAPDEVAVCNLASIALPKFAEDDSGFNHNLLDSIVRIIVRNLNKIIDVNYYPLPEAEKSNKRSRPVAVGVQGLADVFHRLKIPYDSPEAAQLNHDIFETIYFAALSESSELAKIYGPYETYSGSPISKGILQQDMWDSESKQRQDAKRKEPQDADDFIEPEKPAKRPKTNSNRLDWEGLRAKIKFVGVRNSLLVAPMPTASTSQILGNNECFEPYTSNIYTRKVLAGEFTVVNTALVEDLQELGLWNESMKKRIIMNDGSIQGFRDIPTSIQEIHKTAWEISNKVYINMAADRGRYIDQSQSFNLFMKDPTISSLSSMHFYAWEQGLKTGMYYLRTRSKTEANKSLGISSAPDSKDSAFCTKDSDCTACSS